MGSQDDPVLFRFCLVTHTVAGSEREHSREQKAVLAKKCKYLGAEKHSKRNTVTSEGSALIWEKMWGLDAEIA